MHISISGELEGGLTAWINCICEGLTKVKLTDVPSNSAIMKGGTAFQEMQIYERPIREQS